MPAQRDEIVVAQALDVPGLGDDAETGSDQAERGNAAFYVARMRANPEITSAISLVHKAALAVGKLEESVRSKSDVLAETRQECSVLKRDKARSAMDLATALKQIENERARADTAKSHLAACEALILVLKQQVQSLTKQVHELSSPANASRHTNNQELE